MSVIPCPLMIQMSGSTWTTFSWKESSSRYRCPKIGAVEGWAQVGVEIDEHAFELRRYAGLLTHLEKELPTAEATHREWMQFAAAWAELTVLHHRLASALNQEAVDRHRALHLEVEARFAKWMLMRYHTLHSLPFLPMPTMVHHIPDYLAAYRHQHPGCRLALVIVDGLALDQWNLIRDHWIEEAHGWPIQESTAFAWVPTLTPISRQAIFDRNCAPVLSRVVADYKPGVCALASLLA